ncbi:MAG: CU044_2847 family protein [Cyanobacteria bacterium P01_H01_bin.105]
MSFPTQTVPVELEDGSTLYVKVDAPMGRRDVSGGDLGAKKSFERVTSTIETIVKAIAKPVNAAKPTKASVTFGVELEVQQGALIAALAKGTGKTSLEITLEWEKGDGN